jgi:hypothetical protein
MRRPCRFVETILTVVETCHRQSRNIFDYLTTAIQANVADQPCPFTARRGVNGYEQHAHRELVTACCFCCVEAQNRDRKPLEEGRPPHSHRRQSIAPNRHVGQEKLCAEGDKKADPACHPPFVRLFIG